MRGDKDINFIEELSPYVPPLVIRRLEKTSSKSFQAAAEVYSAAVLFIDIKGYSELAERLAGQESEGVEELAQFLNECFNQLIRVITDHGGEVTKFAGDALVAIWPVPQSMSRVGRAAREKLSNLILTATQCALTIQRTCTKLIDIRKGESLLRIGLSAGDIYAVHLGGILDRWEFLLSGEPMVQMSVAKDLAESGEVVLSPEAWDMVSERCSAKMVSGRFARILDVERKVAIQPWAGNPARESMVEGMKSYVPAAITRRLEAGFGQWLSEIRYLTVLFVKLPGYGTSITHPYATSIPEAQAVMRAMQGALYRFEGSINKFNVDDKGITLVAAMGLPPLAHKDDAARGVHAALEMQQVLNALDRSCAIGVASGWVFCGPVGNDSRRGYTVVGNTVNRAARLMQIAEKRRTVGGLPSYVLCDEKTNKVIEREFQGKAQHLRPFVFERLTGVILKGKRTPVTAFRPHLQKRKSLVRSELFGERASFIGRRKERHYLKGHIRALSQSESFLKVMMVEGEEGIGKSALLQEVLRGASSFDVRIVTGGGVESQRDNPYYGWRAIFKQIFDIDIRFDDAGSQRRKVMRKLPSLPGEKGYPALALRLTPLLNPVLGLEFTENRLTKALNPEIREQSTRLFLVRLLQQSFYDAKRHRYQPHVIFLDNGQWLDDESWRLAVTVSNLVRPLLLVIASRPLRQDSLGRPPPAACTELLLNESTLERLRVDLMSSGDMARIHADLIDPCSLSEELENVLWNYAGGNPYFAEQLVSHWRSKDLVCVDVDEQTAIDASIQKGDAPVPGSVKKIIVGRIDRLLPSQQMIIKAASIFEGSFSAPKLDQLLKKIGVNLDLSKYLDSLVDLQLLTQSGEPSEESYWFSYDLIRDVTRGLLTKDQWRVLQDAALRAS